MLQLRDYQVEGVEALRMSIGQLKAAGEAAPRVIACSPTGSGKTVLACHIIEKALAKGSSCLFLAHRQEIIYQTHEKLRTNGVEHGILMASEKKLRHVLAPVQVASIQTLHSWLKRGLGMPSADLIVCDECHRAAIGCKQWTDVLEHYPDVPLLGLTATPARSNNAGLADVWHEIVPISSYRGLIDAGYLVPTEIWAPYVPDLSGVRTTGVDYNEGDLERVMNRGKLIGDIVKTWEKRGELRPTVVFASTIAHSQAITDAFCRAGYFFAHLDGETEKHDRVDLLRQLHEGELQGIVNCAVLTEGWDCPPVSCAVLARPTQSMVLYRQMSGRIQRPWPGKEQCVILDHAGAALKHGFPDDDIDWSLEETRAQAKEASERRASGMVRCPKCKRLYKSTEPACPHCGATRPKRAVPENRPGQLTKLGRDEPTRCYRGGELQGIWASCIVKAARDRHSMRKAAVTFRAITGMLPWDVPIALKYLPRRGTGDWNRSAEDWSWRSGHALDRRIDPSPAASSRSRKVSGPKPGAGSVFDRPLQTSAVPTS